MMNKFKTELLVELLNSVNNDLCLPIYEECCPPHIAVICKEIVLLMKKNNTVIIHDVSDAGEFWSVSSRIRGKGYVGFKYGMDADNKGKEYMIGEFWGVYEGMNFTVTENFWEDGMLFETAIVLVDQCPVIAGK